MRGIPEKRLTPMISERELLQAIRECEAEPVTASKISKLADFYTVYDHLFRESGVLEPYCQNEVEKTIETKGDTEFLAAANGKKADDVWPIIDDLMDTLRVVNEKAYNSVLRKIKAL